MNRRKDLNRLFREHLINKRKNIAPNNAMNLHRVPSANCMLVSSDIKIFFYEWSNIVSEPRVFYQLSVFDAFLKSSNIYLALYQREIIQTLGCVYVSCYRGTKELCIRSSYKHLIDGMNENHVTPKIASPTVIMEEGNRYPENDGTFFG